MEPSSDEHFCKLLSNLVVSSPTQSQHPLTMTYVRGPGLLSVNSSYTVYTQDGSTYLINHKFPSATTTLPLGNVTYISLHPSKPFLCCISDEFLTRVFNIETSQILFEKNYGIKAEWCRCDRVCIALLRSSALEIWDLEEGKIVKKLELDEIKSFDYAEIDGVIYLSIIKEKYVMVFKEFTEGFKTIELCNPEICMVLKGNQLGVLDSGSLVLYSLDNTNCIRSYSLPIHEDVHSIITPESDAVLLYSPQEFEFFFLFLNSSLNEITDKFTFLPLVVQLKKTSEIDIVVRHEHGILIYSDMLKSRLSLPLEEVNEETPLPTPVKSEPESSQTLKTKKSKRKHKRAEPAKPQPVDTITSLMKTVHKNFENLTYKMENSLNVQSLASSICSNLENCLEKRCSKDQDTLRKALIQIMGQVFKEEFRSMVLPQLEAATCTLFRQLYVVLEENIRENAERAAKEEAKFISMQTHLKNAIEAIIAISNKLNKNAFKQLRRVNEFDIKLSEKALEGHKLPIVSNSSSTLKTEVDSLLREANYEKAILKVLDDNNISHLISLLKVMNPKPLMNANLISNEIMIRLLDLLIGNDNMWTEKIIWTEELCRKIPIQLISPFYERMYELSKSNTQFETCCKILRHRLVKT